MKAEQASGAGEGRIDFDLIVVGAGWAGLAAAIEACSSGARVALLDAAPQPGGRARRQSIDLGWGPLALDNGQHLLIGAYRQTLALLSRIGVNPASVFNREGLRMQDKGGLLLKAAPLPAPLHLAGALLTCRGLTFAERLGLLRLMIRLRLARWAARPNETVAALLVRMDQPEELIRRLWAPLCISALNTEPERACAQTFALVLKESLGGERDASDFLLPQATLSECLPDPAMLWLRERGVAVHLRTPVTAIERLGRPRPGWKLTARDQTLTASALILACGIPGTRRLLAGPAEGEALRQTIAALDAHAFEPIATIWTAWPESAWTPLPSPLMFHWPTPAARLADWLFDRGTQERHRIGAMVISVASGAGTFFQASEALERATEICRSQGLAPPSHARAVIERRATFICSPGRPIPIQGEDGMLPGLWLAGDYTEAHYPATIEAAVRSGLQAGSRAAQWLDRSHS